MKKLDADEVGFPKHCCEASDKSQVFSLSSHARARDALAFGLAIGDPGFNIFVLGEDRSGRMTATLSYLDESLRDWPPADDWVYLNNFSEPHRPLPFALPLGTGRAFAGRMSDMIPRLREAFQRAFSNESYQRQLQERHEATQSKVSAALEGLRKEARAKGLDIVQTPQGLSVAPVSPEGEVLAPEQITDEQREQMETNGKAITAKLREINRAATKDQVAFATWVQEYNKRVAENAVGNLLEDLAEDYQWHDGLSAWLADMRSDVIENLQIFLPQQEQEKAQPLAIPERRYAVNVMIDRCGEAHARIVLEPHPTPERLFGRIEYQQAGGVLMTDFTLVRPGALHKANGGVLVLRAEALAAAPDVWASLKAALRDREIQIEPRQKVSPVPLASAPQPHPVPLEVKVVIVGAPRWYYTFFSVDPEFQTFFRVKADVDPDMAASPENLSCFAGLIECITSGKGGYRCNSEAMGYLLGIAARWAGHRAKLTSRFELIEDTLREAAHFLDPEGSREVSAAMIKRAYEQRRQRNQRVEDRVHEGVKQGTVMIDTEGAVVGQINALTVSDMGDHAFGMPSRVTARASVGRRGVINVERDIAMGGPIQQKGVMVLQGFLAGHFARAMPLSFNCSITFEQSYGGVEGDSASLAELLAVLSDLSQVPLRQDLAITGSVNQRGQSQAIGGVHHKIEGFFRVCQEKGGLTGTQGVVIPSANIVNVVLRDDVTEAVAEGKFHIYAIENVEQAIALFTGLEAGQADEEGRYPKESLYGRVADVLAIFDSHLMERSRPYTGQPGNS